MSEFRTTLETFEDQVLTPTTWGPDAVNTPMIRHWVETMGDTNPVYLDDDAAHATGRDRAVAPALMTQVWTMRTFTDKMADNDPSQVWTDLIAIFDEAGFTSVVATDSDFEFFVELKPGDRVSLTEVIEEISEEKKTSLGAGHFVTTRKTYRNGDDEIVATQRWRTLRFAPKTAGASTGLPPRPALNADNAFRFDTAAQHRPVIQRCTGCGTLQHSASRGYQDVTVGELLPELAIPLTRTLIVSTAIATRDFQDVHHDPELARERGSKDIFMNILTSNGLAGRFVTDWAGPFVTVRRVEIRLGAPNYPGDTMMMTGAVVSKENGLVEVKIVGANSLGNHLSGTVTVAYPAADEGEGT